MTLNDIGKAMRSVLSAMVRAAWGITLCAGGLAVGIAGAVSYTHLTLPTT